MDELLYLIATALFIFGIKRLSRVKTARSGNQLAAVGMLLAVIAVLIGSGALTWWLLILGLAIGGGIGAVLAKRVPMTAMPEMVAAFNGLGGAASAFIALAWLVVTAPALAGEASIAEVFPWLTTLTVPLAVLLGMVTLSGSFVAYFKLKGKKLVHPLKGNARHGLHVGLVIVALFLSLWMVVWSSGGVGTTFAAILLVLTCAALGVFLVLPIGGADMPVVVALLNSYSGVAGSMSGFVIGNSLLVVAGALVGASGLILTRIMCKAMNRSLGNVLMGGISDEVAGQVGEYVGVKSTSPEEVALLFDGAANVIMIPGYGLAVAQAQHAMRELGDILEGRGCKVRYAIHPVAGRMPGHMNVLLAEADVPYDKLFEMDAINNDFKNADVALVVGANDVVNPAARTEEKSPIYGMPILNVDQARTCVVVKRSLGSGYAGIKNPLFEAENCLMLFMDGKAALEELVKETKSL